jgi:hypothetical protein
MRLAAILVVVFSLAGCGKTAKIYKKNGKVVEGEITRGDSTHVYIVRARFPDDPGGRSAHLRGQKEPKIIPEVLDECVTGCKKACRERYPYRNLRDEFLKCRILCTQQKKTKSECQELSTEIPIPRRNIRDISHPGKTAAITGSVLTVVGAFASLFATPLFYSCGEWGCGSYQLYALGIAGGIAAVVGLIVGTGGYISWLGSISAAKPTHEPSSPKIAPVSMTDGENTYYGLGISWSW